MLSGQREQPGDREGQMEHGARRTEGGPFTSSHALRVIFVGSLTQEACRVREPTLGPCAGPVGSSALVPVVGGKTDEEANSISSKYVVFWKRQNWTQ